MSTEAGGGSPQDGAVRGEVSGAARDGAVRGDVPGAGEPGEVLAGLAPLGEDRLGAVPGVLGRIVRERAADYAGTDVHAWLDRSVHRGDVSGPGVAGGPAASDRRAASGRLVIRAGAKMETTVFDEAPCPHRKTILRDRQSCLQIVTGRHAQTGMPDLPGSVGLGRGS